MKVALCVPLKDGRMCWQTHVCLARDIQNLRSLGYEPFPVYVPGCSLPSFARNELVFVARDAGADFIVQIDDDMAWDEQSLLRILANMRQHPELEFVVGAARYKDPNAVKWNVGWIEDREQLLSHPATKYIEINNCGGAFSVATKGLFDRLETYLTSVDPNYRFRKPDGDQKPRIAFYEAPMSWGEDMRFCDHVRKAGMQVWLDAEVHLDHIIAPGWAVSGKIGDWLRERKAEAEKASAPTEPAFPGFPEPTEPAFPGFPEPTEPAFPGFPEPTEPAFPGFPPATEPPDERMIHLLCPTRKRPEKAQRFIRSVLETARRPDRVLIHLGVDLDDESDSFMTVPWKRVITHKEERTLSVGELLDRMAIYAAAMQEDSIIGIASDDCTYATEGWDAKVRQAVRKDGIYSPSLEIHDPAAVGGVEHTESALAYYPFMTRAFADKLRDVQGFVVPHWFAFWFTDTWLDEIGEMMGARTFMDWSAVLPEGQGLTRGMRDLAFWCEFFEETRPERELTAAKLTGEPIAVIHERAKACAAKRAHHRDPDFLAFWSRQAEQEANPRYDELRAQAEEHLREIGVSAPAAMIGNAILWDELRGDSVWRPSVVQAA